MDSLDEDALGYLLDLVGWYRPVLRHVCARWRAACARLAVEAKPRGLLTVAVHGYDRVLDWVLALRGAKFSARQSYSIMAGAAWGGHVALMHKAKEWGATNFGDALCNSAEEGLTDAMTLAKDWGGRDLKGHPGLPRAEGTSQR